MSFSGRLARGTFVASTIVLLAACTGNGSTCNAIPAVFNGPAIVIPTLVSPASGAAGVSAGPLDVTIGNAVSATALFVKDGGGNVTTATNFRPVNPPAIDIRVGTFARIEPHTTYQVFATIPSYSAPASSCSPTATAVVFPQDVLLGSFTTS
jgi:hypothetical protein